LRFVPCCFFAYGLGAYLVMAATHRFSTFEKSKIAQTSVCPLGKYTAKEFCVGVEPRASLPLYQIRFSVCMLDTQRETFR
jgi:hypothetical protein